MSSPHTHTRDLVDVVNLVVQIIWADFRRSRLPIEPSQWSTLRYLVNGPCGMSELARHKGVGLPTMSKSVDMLVKRGWAERVTDETDRRQTLVRLTSSGRRVLADCRKRFEALIDRKLSGLTAKERKELAASLTTLRRVLGPAEGSRARTPTRSHAG